MGAAAPLEPAASGLLARRGARAPRAWRCPCPPNWGEGLGLGAALGGQLAVWSRAPIAPASPRARGRSWGGGRVGTGRSAGVGGRAARPRVCGAAPLRREAGEALAGPRLRSGPACLRAPGRPGPEGRRCGPSRREPAQLRAASAAAAPAASRPFVCGPAGPLPRGAGRRTAASPAGQSTEAPGWPGSCCSGPVRPLFGPAFGPVSSQRS